MNNSYTRTHYVPQHTKYMYTLYVSHAGTSHDTLQFLATSQVRNHVRPPMTLGTQIKYAHNYITFSTFRIRII